LTVDQNKRFTAEVATGDDLFAFSVEITTLHDKLRSKIKEVNSFE